MDASENPFQSPTAEIGRIEPSSSARPPRPMPSWRVIVMGLGFALSITGGVAYLVLQAAQFVLVSFGVEWFYASYLAIGYVFLSSFSMLLFGLPAIWFLRRRKQLTPGKAIVWISGLATACWWVALVVIVFLTYHDRSTEPINGEEIRSVLIRIAFFMAMGFSSSFFPAALFAWWIHWRTPAAELEEPD